MSCIVYIQCLTYFFCCIHVLLVSLLLVMCSFFLPLHCLFNQSKRIFISQFLFVFLFSLKEVYVDGMCVVKHSNNNFVEKYITMYEACIMQSIHIETWSYRHNKDIKSSFHSSWVMKAIRMIFITTKYPISRNYFIIFHIIKTMFNEENDWYVQTLT